MLSVLSGHRRYSRVTALRCDPVNPPLLGMRKIVSEDAVRRGLTKIGEAKGLNWLQNHLDYCTTPLLSEQWVLNMDSTVKTLYGHQEGAEIGYNPAKPGRPSCVHECVLSGVKIHPRRSYRPVAGGNCVIREAAWETTRGERAIRRKTNSIRPCCLASHRWTGEARTRANGKPTTLR
jgi:hypothetical protein